MGIRERIARAEYRLDCVGAAGPIDGPADEAPDCRVLIYPPGSEPEADPSPARVTIYLPDNGRAAELPPRPLPEAPPHSKLPALTRPSREPDATADSTKISTTPPTAPAPEPPSPASHSSTAGGPRRDSEMSDAFESFWRHGYPHQRR